MDTSKFDNKINELTVKQKKIIIEMGDIYEKFTEASINFVRKWSKKQVEKYVGSQYKITLSRSDSELKELKINCRDLIEELPSITDENLKTKDYWVHMHDNKIDKFYSNKKNYNNRLKDAIIASLSLIMGRTGIILSKHNYVNLHQDSDWKHYTDGTVKYEIRKIEINNEMEIYLDEYLKKSEALKSITMKISSAKIDREKFKAIQKWKQIKVKN